MQHTGMIENNMKSKAVPSMQLILEDGDYQVRLASNFEDRRKAYQHVYSLYVQKGYAKPNSSQMWLTLFDAHPETTTFLVERAGQVIGAMTVVFDSPLGIPADSLYKKELDTLRVSGRRLTEYISLGVNDGDAQVLVKLFNLAYLVSYRLCDTTDIVITVNPRHARFYEKTLLFQKAGPERSYHKVGGAPAVLLRLNEALSEEQIRLEHSPKKLGSSASRSLYKFFYPEVNEPNLVASIATARCPMSKEEFDFFLVRKTNIWVQANAEQRAYLSLCYPYGLVPRQMNNLGDLRHDEIIRQTMCGKSAQTYSQRLS
jgi:hypothetical protein